MSLSHLSWDGALVRKTCNSMSQARGAPARPRYIVIPLSTRKLSYDAGWCGLDDMGETGDMGCNS